MRKTSLILAVIYLALAGGAAWAEGASDIFDSPAPPKPAGPLDKIVFAKLSSLDIEPVLCSDAVFVRRPTWT